MYGSARSLARARGAAGSTLVGALLLAGCSAPDAPDGAGSEAGSTVRQRPRSVVPYWVDPRGERRAAGPYRRRGRRLRAGP